MIVRKKELKPVDTTVDLVCDVCKTSCSVDVCGEVGFEFAMLKANWGYGSGLDGSRYEIHLCEKCFCKVMGFLSLPLSEESTDETGASS